MAAGLLLLSIGFLGLSWWLAFRYQPQPEPEDLGSVSPAELQRLRDER